MSASGWFNVSNVWVKRSIVSKCNSTRTFTLYALFPRVGIPTLLNVQLIYKVREKPVKKPVAADLLRVPSLKALIIYMHDEREA